MDLSWPDIRKLMSESRVLAWGDILYIVDSGEEGKVISLPLKKLKTKRKMCVCVYFGFNTAQLYTLP